MKVPLVVIFQLLIGPSLWASTSFSVSSPPSTWPPQKSRPFPVFSFVDEAGKVESVANLKGKWILLEPIGMNCPACLAFSGAAEKGTLENFQPQPKLNSLTKILAEQGVDLKDVRIQLVQLLLYDLHMKPTTLADAKLWREKFDIGKGSGHWVVAGGPAMIHPASYEMIPGFYLIDPSGNVISDSTGHAPKDGLWTHLAVALREGLAGRHAAIGRPLAEIIEAEIGLSPADAYKKIPHQRTEFSIAESTLPEGHKQQLFTLLKAADLAVALRVKLHEAITVRKSDVSEDLKIYDQLKEMVREINDVKLIEPKRLITEAWEDQRAFFGDWQNGHHHGELTHPKVQAASTKLKQAYALLMREFSSESVHNKQSFFDDLCALDFL